LSSDPAPWLAGSRWPTIPIRYVARLGTGHTPSRRHPEYWENCTIPWVTLADVWQLRDGTTDIIRETAEKISTLGLANSAAVKHSAGTVILSRTASVGFSGILGSDMATSQDFATWTCGPRLYPRYLLYALRAMAPDLRRLSSGSTHKTVYMPDIEELRIPLPPIPEQLRIAAYLDAQTALLNRAQSLPPQVVKKAEHRDLTILDTEIDRLAACHDFVPFGNFITRAEQGISPQCDNVEAAEGEWGVLKISAVRDGVLRSRENKKLPDDIPPTRRYEIRSGDLLITRANTPSLVGATAVVRDPRPRLLLCDKIFRVAVSAELDKEFLVHVARGSRVRALCAAASHGASQSMANLKIGDIREWPIPAAPPPEQLRLVTLAAESQARTARLRLAAETELALLNERRQALITLAVTGQIDVTTAREFPE
jgi:type I restriction enzyme, S subunit